MGVILTLADGAEQWPWADRSISNRRKPSGSNRDVPSCVVTYPCPAKNISNLVPCLVICFGREEIHTFLAHLHWARHMIIFFARERGSFFLKLLFSRVSARKKNWGVFSSFLVFLCFLGVGGGGVLFGSVFCFSRDSGKRVGFVFRAEPSEAGDFSLRFGHPFPTSFPRQQDGPPGKLGRTKKHQLESGLDQRDEAKSAFLPMQHPTEARTQSSAGGVL